MAAETVRLEGFSESLRGTNAFCVGAGGFAQNFLKGRMAALDAEVTHRGRKVLVCQGTYVAPRWLLNLGGWDAVFRIREIQDLKLALTYIQHTARPTRVVWTGLEPAAAVMTTLGRLDGITLIGVGEKAPVHPDWQLIFWAPDAIQEEVEVTLTARMGPTGVTGLRSILKELRAAHVGLVWSSKDEDKHGSLYWYEPADGVELATTIDMQEAAAVLTEVAAFLTR